jgi:GAF domain-containing protein
MHIGMHYFHYSLTLAALYYQDNPPGQTMSNSLHYVEKINENMVVLRKWAKNSPINCEHRCVLIEAELAHIAHRDQEALQLYEAALHHAEEHDFHHYAAITLERMVNFFVRIGQTDHARETLTRSIDGYVRWGACAVVAVLIAEHSDLLPAKSLVPLDSSTYTVPVSTSGTDIDLNAVLECSSVVCENLNLNKLVTNFLSQIVTYFRAAYGCMILAGPDGKCSAHVQWSRQQTETPCATLLNPPILVSGTSDVSSMVCCSRSVRCALLTKRTVIVNDLLASGMYTDTYFTSERNACTRSLVCVPLLLRGSVRAFAYLESDSVFPFTVGNLQTLQLMCAQASIALENSRLIELEMGARAEAEAATAEKDALLQEMQASEQRYQVLAQSIPQVTISQKKKKKKKRKKKKIEKKKERKKKKKTLPFINFN